RLAAQPVGADGEKIVLAPRAADEAGGLVLVFGDEPAVGADLDVAAGFGAAVVAGRAVGVEPDESREAPRAAIHLVDDLLVIDPLEQLPGDADPRRRALLPELIEEAVGDELQALLDQLVVDLALPLDLVWRLLLRGQAGLQLAEADVVEASGVDVVAGEAAAGATKTATPSPSNLKPSGASLMQSPKPTQSVRSMRTRRPATRRSSQSLTSPRGRARRGPHPSRPG